MPLYEVTVGTTFVIYSEEKISEIEILKNLCNRTHIYFDGNLIDSVNVDVVKELQKRDFTGDLEEWLDYLPYNINRSENQKTCTEILNENSLECS